MKIIALGDTHGRDNWKQVASREQFDKLIFIGDYFDSHDGISAAEQKGNFKEILEYKKRNSEKVVLLIGNHDFHYLDGVYETYGGFQEEQRSSIRALLQPAVDSGMLQICFVWKHLLFTHAGVTKTWHSNHLQRSGSIEYDINLLFKQDKAAFEFAWGRTNRRGKGDGSDDGTDFEYAWGRTNRRGKGDGSDDGTDFEYAWGRTYSPTGDDPEQSPIWVRPASLLEDRVDNYVQVVGHTIQKSLMLSDEVIFIDTLGTTGEYVVYEDGKFSIGKHK